MTDIVSTSSVSSAARIAKGRLDAIVDHLPKIADLQLANVANQTLEQPEYGVRKQEPHSTLLIPGPVEFSDEVLHSMGHFSESHVSPSFVKTFSEVLQMTRRLFQTENKNSQPFVIAGSGTLGWDQVATNLTEPGDEALVIRTGFFGGALTDCLETYGVNVTELHAPFGEPVGLAAVERALTQKKFKLMTITHVDTSSGVLSDIEALSKAVHRLSPGTLVVVDGVCSVGAEDLRFDDMQLDVVVTAPQKAIGCPAGLSIVMASERAIGVYKTRKSRPATYFSSWKNWIPVMQAYEAGKVAYFATPPSQLIHALHTALSQILSQGMDARVQRHREMSKKIKAACEEIGLRQVARHTSYQACTLTTVWLPKGIAASDMVGWLSKHGLVVAGGLQKPFTQQYIRIGHMGTSVMDRNRSDVDFAISALRQAVAEFSR